MSNAIAQLAQGTDKLTVSAEKQAEISGGPSVVGVDLIEKLPKESLSQFYARAEKRGIQRFCLHCGAKRRYSLVNCPVCTCVRFKQVQGIIPKDPVEGTPAAPYDPTAMPEAVVNGGFQFTPVTEEDAGAESVASPAPAAPTPVLGPLEDLTVNQLRGKAGELGIDHSKLTKKDQLLEAINAKLSG